MISCVCSERPHGILCVGELRVISGVWASPEKVGDCRSRDTQGRAEAVGAKVQKGGEEFSAAEGLRPLVTFHFTLCYCSTVGFCHVWVFIFFFFIPVLCSHFSWFALVLTPSFSPPPHPPPVSSLTPIVECVICVCCCLCPSSPHGPISFLC